MKTAPIISPVETIRCSSAEATAFVAVPAIEIAVLDRIVIERRSVEAAALALLGLLLSPD